MVKKQRVLVRPEQVLVMAHDGDSFIFGGGRYEHMPWHEITSTFVYALRDIDLHRALGDAARRGYQILSGYTSERRNLRGFILGVGAWGHRGKIEVRTTDVWGLEHEGVSDEDDLEAVVQRTQVTLRRLCQRLNTEPTPFRPSAYRYLSALYDRLGLPREADGFATPLPVEIAELCRRAHVGGPVVHARTSLAPFTSIDRIRAYGNAMLKPLPVGPAVDIPIRGSGLLRWRPHDLMRACGIADATVRVHRGPVIPLLPLLQPASYYARSRTLYPTGTFRGCWPLSELSYLEESGRGEVLSIHRVVTFETAPVLRSVVLYIRKLEADGAFPEGVKPKRLEHILYGKCARSLKLGRIGTVSPHRPSLPMDLLDDRAMRRLEGRVEMRPQPLPAGQGSAQLPLVRLQAKMSAKAERGSMDRPDRSAIITSRNRVAIARIIDHLDERLGAERSGEYVGRIYVDGIDVQATPSQVGPIEGAEIRRSGTKMRLYRAAALAAYTDSGVEIDGAGLIEAGSTEAELVDALLHTPDADGGPFASGRFWERKERELDPRMEPDRASAPPHIDEAFAEALGFSRRFDRRSA